MKVILSLAFVATAVAAMLAQAQTTSSGGGHVVPTGPIAYPDYGNYPYSSTAGEGFARGIGDVIRAQGEYNLNSSQAAINLTEAKRREIEDRKQWTATYFAMREINRQNREAERNRHRVNAEDWARYAQAGRPKLLANQELDALTGKIHWPILLTAQDFDAQRAELEKLFADRAYHGVVTVDDLLAISRLTQEMIAGLKDHVQEYPVPQYIAAKKFLESLAYEAGRPAG